MVYGNKATTETEVPPLRPPVDAKTVDYNDLPQVQVGVLEQTEKEQGKEMKTWRDVYKVHPAADLFPMLPEDELRKLGEDIKANGLKERIVLWSPGAEKDDPKEVYLLDGRNRLAAMELCGLNLTYNPNNIRFVPDDLKGTDSIGNDASRRYFELRQMYSLTGNGIGKARIEPSTDPYGYVLSRNIHRRHLTKEQQADLIVKVMKAKQAGLANIANPVKPRNAKGQLQGQTTKDTFKAKVVKEAAQHGISKRTVEKAIAKDRGPTLPKREKQLSPMARAKAIAMPGEKMKLQQDIESGGVTAEHAEAIARNIEKRYGPRPKVPTEPPKPTSDPGVREGKTDFVALCQKLDAANKKLFDENLSLQKQINEMLSGTFNFLTKGGLDVEKIRRDMVKKYHPDGNSNRILNHGRYQSAM